MHRTQALKSARWIGARIVAWRVVQMFREDRLLLWLTGALTFAVMFPMFLTPFLPLVDLGSHVGSAGLVDEVLAGRAVAERFSVNWSLLPYSSGYALLSFFDFFGGPMFAAKATVALVVLLLPLSHMRLLIALGRSPRLGLWAFIFAWDVNLYWGWFTFQLGMALALWAFAWMIEAKTVREAAKIIPLTGLIALTHLHAVALVGLGGVVLALGKVKPFRALLHHAVALSGLAMLLPWLIKRLIASGPGGHLNFQPAALTEKVNSLYRFSIDTLPSATGVTLTICAFMLVLLSPAVLSALDHREAPERSGLQAFMVGACCLALYIALPFSVTGSIEHFWTYPRYATYLLLALLMLPSPSLVGRKAWLLAPGFLMVLALNVERSRQFADFGDRTRPYLEIIAAMKPDSKFLPLDYESSWAGTREWPLGQMHGYAAAARAAYDPHLWDHDNSAILYRKENRLPSPDWWHMSATFSMAAQGRFYDYIIVHPLSHDTQLLPADVELVKEAGEWRLYAVRPKP